MKTAKECNRSIARSLNGSIILANCRVGLLRIDSQFLDRALHHVRADFLLTRQRPKSRQHDVLGVDLEEIPQRNTVLAASKAVSAESNKLSRHPFRQTLRQDLY